MTDVAEELPEVVEVRCQGVGVLEIEQMHELQGELKTLTEDGFRRLRKEILQTGMAFPFRLWLDPDGKHWIVGGHQTKRVLTQIRFEGIAVPEMPYTLVEADSIEQAKRRVLQDVSQYGEVDRQGLYEFLHGSGITLPDLQDSMVLPNLDLHAFGDEFFHDMPSEIGSGTPDASPRSDATPDFKPGDETDQGKLDTKSPVICPNCSHEFTP